MMNIKKIGIDKTCSSYEEFKNNHVVSQGWPNFGDMSYLKKLGELGNYLDLNKLINFFVANFPEYYCDKRCRNAFKNLFYDIKPNTVVVAIRGQAIQGIAEMPEDFQYYYDENVENYSNCLFPVNWVDWQDFCKDPSLGRVTDYNGVPGIVNFSTPKDIVAYINNNWEKYKESHNYILQLPECEDKLNSIKSEFNKKVKASKESIFKLINDKNMSKEVSKYIPTLLSNHNLILTGAPGTGKTFLANKIADSMDAEKEFVQFHPSYDYTDFVEGLRPTTKDNDGNIGFELVDGVFKQFCIKALENLEEAEENSSNPQNDEVSENKTVKPKNFVFIIDEINRGEISKIFGELFYSIDPDYRVNKYSIKEEAIVRTQYANMQNEPNAFDKYLIKYGVLEEAKGSEHAKRKKIYGHFFVPSNVYIIGTMNDIDRSVESMDFAMRRRFAWKEVLASDSMLNNNEKLNGVSEDVIKQLKNRMDNLNKAIIGQWNKNEDNAEIADSLHLGTAYQIGGSYFLKYAKYQTDENPFEELWTNHIENVLKEYLRGNTNIEEQIKYLKSAYNDGNNQ